MTHIGIIRHGRFLKYSRGLQTIECANIIEFQEIM